MIPNVFDCQAFHELCMDYRGAVLPDHAQGAYERLQAYCSNALSDLRNQIATAAPLVHSGLAEVGCWHGTEDWEAVTAAKAAMDRLTVLAEAQK
jgi:hypothetical protein